ncbi:MAG: N-acetylmuramoyl-L-alanine amidase, partial [Opitutales bacterium]
GLAMTAQAADVEVYGTTYRPLEDVAAQFGLRATWITPEKTMALKGQYSTLDFTVNEREMHLNYQPVAFGSPVIYYKGELWISKKDAEKNIGPLLAPLTLPNPPALHRIVLDPGHGGKDPGGENLALGVNEKVNTLDVALRLAKILRAQGYEVTLTRQDDHFVELKERAAIANAARGDLYISMHFNIAADPAVNGIETYVLTPAGQPSSGRTDLQPTDKVVLPNNRYDGWNAVAGFSVEWAATHELQANNRGLKRARYAVFTDLQMPGMLIEGGFLTNTTEGRKIATAAYHEQLAQAIADGIALYAKTLEKAHAAAAGKG